MRSGEVDQELRALVRKASLWFDFFDDKMSMINISFVDTNKITFFECTLSSPSFATYLLS